jgi:Family of unknown function (DUF5403)
MASVRRGLDKRLARMRVVGAKLDEVAREVLDVARTRAQAHRHTGDFADNLSIEHGRVDARVESDDPQALSKEYGHTDPRTGRHVDGTHVLGGAAADVAARK